MTNAALADPEIDIVVNLTSIDAHYEVNRDRSSSVYLTDFAPVEPLHETRAAARTTSSGAARVR